MRVRDETMWIAKELVKAELKRQGIKPAYVESSALSEAAKYLIKQEPIIRQIAQLNLRGKP